jgi:MFS family permease
MAALAGLASAVFFAQVLDGQGMVAALAGVELARLQPPEEGGSRRGGAGGPTWIDVYAGLRGALGTHPATRGHSTVGRLLRLVVDVERGREPAPGAAAQARGLLPGDGQNLVARLACGVVEDIAGGAGRTASERFESLRERLERLPPADRSTLYNREYLRAWHDVLRAHLRRPDVAACAAVGLDHYEIVDHYAALPMMERRLAGLAEALRAEGRAAESQECRRWMARLCLGLMEADTSAGTRLLCADLLARAGASPAAAEAARRLRQDFHERAGAAPPNLLDPQKRPAADARWYRWASRGLAVSVVFWLAGLGGLGMAILAAMAAAARLAVPSRRQREARSVAALPAARAAALVLCLLSPMLVRGWQADEWVNESWAVLAGVSTAAMGAVAAALVGRLGARERVASGRMLATMGVALVLALAGLLPRAAVAEFCRWVDAAGGRWMLWGGAPLGAVAMAVSASGLNWRVLGRCGVAVWLAGTIAGLGVFQAARVTDRRHQEQTVAGAFDEVTLRLGADWRERYLRAMLAAQVPASTTTERGR